MRMRRRRRRLHPAPYTLRLYVRLPPLPPACSVLPEDVLGDGRAVPRLEDLRRGEPARVQLLVHQAHFLQVVGPPSEVAEVDGARHGAHHGGIGHEVPVYRVVQGVVDEIPEEDAALRSCGLPADAPPRRNCRLGGEGAEEGLLLLLAAEERTAKAEAEAVRTPPPQEEVPGHHPDRRFAGLGWWEPSTSQVTSLFKSGLSWSFPFERLRAARQPSSFFPVRVLPAPGAPPEGSAGCSPGRPIQIPGHPMSA
mmetsp:Transcript_22774/g.70748  ORF Transcript_22774/g.70748 Transcript_22774/m.70748 type:complete len:252 (+) Transcript_22774:38-793(+)